MLRSEVSEGMMLSHIYHCPYGYAHFISSILNLLSNARSSKLRQGAWNDFTAREIIYGRKGMRVSESYSGEADPAATPEEVQQRRTRVILCIALTTMKRWAHGNEWYDHVIMLLDSYIHVFRSDESVILKTLYDIDEDAYNEVALRLRKPRN